VANLSCQHLSVIKKAENYEVFVNSYVQRGAGFSADPKIITKHVVEFMQDAMEVVTIESCRAKLVGDNISSTSDTSTKLTCSSLLHGTELSGTSLEDQGPSHSSESLANDKSYMKYHSDCTSGVNKKTVLVH
jgi:ribonuclease P/MRP protein subunit RPP1